MFDDLETGNKFSRNNNNIKSSIEDLRREKDSNSDDTYRKTDQTKQMKKIILLVIFMVFLAAVMFVALFAISYYLKIQKNPATIDNNMELLLEDFDTQELDIVDNNNEEYLKSIDSDGDGLTDWEEINIYKTDPFNPDTDGDGLTDWEEVMIYKTDPLNPDTDGDGYTDGEEVAAGYNPLGEGLLINQIQ